MILLRKAAGHNPWAEAFRSKILSDPQTAEPAGTKTKIATTLAFSGFFKDVRVFLAI